MLKHRCEAILWHTLIFVLKIAVIIRDQHRHSSCHFRTDLFRLLSPLFHGIFQKYILIDILCDLTDIRIIILTKFHDRHTASLTVSFDQFFLQKICFFLIIDHVQRI